MNPLHWLLGSRFLGGLGYQILLMSGILEIYRSSHSAILTGLTGLVLFVPTASVNLWLAPWVERLHSKGRIYVLIQWAIAGLSAGMLFQQVRSSSAAVLVGLFIYSALRSLRTPLYYTLAHLCEGEASVTKGQLAQLSSLSWQIPLLVGPFVFSLILQSVGPGGPALVGLFIFAMAALASLRMWRIRPAPSAEGIRAQESWRQIFSAHPVWLKTSLLDAVVMGCLSFVSVTPFLLVRIQEDPTQIGYVRSAISLGVLVCIWVFEWEAVRAQRSRTFLFALGAACVSVLLIPLANHFWILIFLSFMFGLCDGFSILYREYLIFLLPQKVMARSAVLSQILNSASEDLGEFRAGLLGGDGAGVVRGIVASAFTAGTILICFAAREKRAPPKLDLDPCSDPRQARLNKALLG